MERWYPILLDGIKTSPILKEAVNKLHIIKLILI